MIEILKPFNLAEWYVIASFSLLMGCALTGICHILIGDPIFSSEDWTGLGVLIVACTLGIASICFDHENRI